MPATTPTKKRSEQPKQAERVWPKLHPDVASGAALATVEEVALAFRLCVSTVWKLKAAGVLTPVNLAGPVRFHLPTVRAQVMARQGTSK